MHIYDKTKYVPCFLLLYILLLYFSQFQMCFDQADIWETMSIQEKYVAVSENRKQGEESRRKQKKILEEIGR